MEKQVNIPRGIKLRRIKEDKLMLFKDSEHQAFYEEMVARTYSDSYHRSFFYTLGILPDTRRNINTLYDFHGHCIDVKGLRMGWQTGTSIKVCRLAFNLYNGYLQSGKLAAESTPYELFCCEAAPYMLEAIKIRYADYCAKV